MNLKVNSSNYFHPNITMIDEKLYGDPIWIIPPHLGRILVPKIFTEGGEEIFPLPSLLSIVYIFLEFVLSIQYTKGHFVYVLYFYTSSKKLCLLPTFPENLVLHPLC
jgi:hypothetical protein